MGWAPSDCMALAAATICPATWCVGGGTAADVRGASLADTESGTLRRHCGACPVPPPGRRRHLARCPVSQPPAARVRSGWDCRPPRHPHAGAAARCRPTRRPAPTPSLSARPRAPDACAGTGGTAGAMRVVCQDGGRLSCRGRTDDRSQIAWRCRRRGCVRLFGWRLIGAAEASASLGRFAARRCRAPAKSRGHRGRRRRHPGSSTERSCARVPASLARPEVPCARGGAVDATSVAGNILPRGPAPTPIAGLRRAAVRRQQRSRRRSALWLLQHRLDHRSKVRLPADDGDEQRHRSTADASRPRIRGCRLKRG